MERIINKQNYLLIKDDVGRSKPATFKLPSHGTDFTYGKPQDRSQEGAGAITRTWETSQKSSLAQKGQTIPRDFKKINKMKVNRHKSIL